jgi:hypothetical protein
MKQASTLDDDMTTAERVVYTFTRMSAKNKGQGTRTKGVLVLDHNVGGLAPALEDAGFSVIIVPAKADDHEEIKPVWLQGRILVTRNASDFKDPNEIRTYNYGIIALEGIKFIDTAPTLAQNLTARIIVQGYRKYRLTQAKTKFMLEAKAIKGGKPTTRRDVFVDFAPETRKQPRPKSAADETTSNREDVIVYKFRRF